jgi:glycoside/pentoside/hexuronide:cation symporter, GPH family
MSAEAADAQYAPAATSNAKVPGRLKLVYGLGNTAEGIVSAALSTYGFFYFTAVLGLSGTLAGLAMAISLVIDAFLDPMLGSVSDNTRTRWGRRHPMMAASLLPLVVTLGLMFATPTGLDQTVLFAWLTVLAIVHRICLSAFSIPYTAFGAELTNDYRERTSVVTIGRLFSVVGTVIAVVLGYGVFLAGPGGTLDAHSYAPLGWVCAGIALVFGVAFLLATVRTGRAAMPDDPPSGGAALRRLPAEVREVLSNRSFRVLFTGLVLFFAAIGSHLALSLHANTFFWKLAPAEMAGASGGYLIGILLGVPASALIGARLEKRTQVFIGLGTLCLTWTILPLAWISGGTGMDHATLVGLLTLNWCIAGVGSTVCTIAYGSMMGDAADEHESLFGVRREGLYFAGLAFAAKTATGLGTLLAGLGLDLVGFPGGLQGREISAVQVDPQTVLHLGWVYGPGTALLTLMSMLVLLAYRIDSRAHARIVFGLKARVTGLQTGS